MGEYFWIIAIIVFFVAPVLEKILKAGRGDDGQQLPPGQRTPQQRIPGQPPVRPGAQAPGDTPPRPEDRAAELIPAELWEILTGQKRPEPRAPQPPPLPPPPAESDAAARARERAAETQRREALREEGRQTRAAERAAQAAARRSARTSTARPSPPMPRKISPPLRPAAVGRPIGDEEGAAAELIHRREDETARRRKYDHESGPIVSLETEPLDEPRRHAAFHDKLAQLSTPATAHTDSGTMVRLGKGTELRRAIILKEVLDPPKGLE
jgi:hypothetical protein